MTAQAGVTLGELLAALVPDGLDRPGPPRHAARDRRRRDRQRHPRQEPRASRERSASHVRALGLLTAAGEVRELAGDDDDAGLLAATIGGMGLTGVIVWARIGLRPSAARCCRSTPIGRESLDDALSLLRAPGGPYRVAWLDLLGPRAGAGRRDPRRAHRRRAPRLGCGRGARPSARARPFLHAGQGGCCVPPRSGVQRAAIPAHPAARARPGGGTRRAHVPARRRSTPGRGCTGARGFVQYQFVVPAARAKRYSSA